MEKYVIIIIIVLFAGFACSTSRSIIQETDSDIRSDKNSNSDYPIPPVAQIRPYKTQMHDETLEDNYHWLKDKDRSDKDVLAYLEAENEYTNKMMKHTEAMQTTLFEEIIGRIKETDLAVPVKIDDYYYYTRTEKGKQYRIYCRKKYNLEADEEIILDVNEVGSQYEYFQVGETVISPNHRYMAYLVDTSGNEVYQLFIKDLNTGDILPDTVSAITSFEWANDNQTCFYTIENEANRSFKAYRHILGTSIDEDTLIFHEKDDSFYLWVYKTRSKKFIVLGTASSKTSEMSFVDADKPADNLKLFHPRKHGVEYYISHNDNNFYIMTNDEDAKNFKVMNTPVEAYGHDNWKVLIPPQEDVFISNVDVLINNMIVYERKLGLIELHVYDFDTMEDHYINFPEPIYSIFSHDNPNFDSHVYRLTYNSLITPQTVYDYDIVERKLEVKKQVEVLGGYDSTEYYSERLFATGSDGTKVPMSLVYKKDLFHQNGDNPLFLEAYGSYGISSDPYFSSIRLSLLDRGFVYCLAHVRGGGELGEDWHEQGRMLNKKNTFTDFIACAERLIELNYTSSEKLVIYGGSAGGLLIGAVTNMRPELFHISLYDVPFVDVLNTMLDPSLSATVVEYEEWGNPNEKKYFDYIRSYCPYQNVKAQDYPHILVTGGFYDPRVNYWEPAKLTAKLRALKTDNNKLLLKISMAGHGGASGRYDFLKEIAFGYAFVFDILSINI